MYHQARKHTNCSDHNQRFVPFVISPAMHLQFVSCLDRRHVTTHSYISEPSRLAEQHGHSSSAVDPSKFGANAVSVCSKTPEEVQLAQSPSSCGLQRESVQPTFADE